MPPRGSLPHARGASWRHTGPASAREAVFLGSLERVTTAALPSAPADGGRVQRRRRHRALLAALTALTAATTLGLTGCGLGGEEPAPTPTIHKNLAPGGVRTDLDPLTKRYAVLGQPRGASWVSGTVGDDRVPGPATYWIDAVVTLAPSTAADLRARGGVMTTRQIDVHPDLAATVPAGGLVGSEALDAALSTSGWRTTAGFATDGRTLVFTSLGQ